MIEGERGSRWHRYSTPKRVFVSIWLLLWSVVSAIAALNGFIVEALFLIAMVAQIAWATWGLGGLAAVLRPPSAPQRVGVVLGFSLLVSLFELIRGLTLLAAITGTATLAIGLPLLAYTLRRGIPDDRSVASTGRRPPRGH